MKSNEVDEMSCEEHRENLVSFLYDEIDEMDRKRFEAHIKECASCRAEVAAFRGVREIMASWPPPAEETGFIFVEENVSSGLSLRGWWKKRRRWMKVALAVPAAALLVLAVLNLEVSYNEGGFHARVGLWPPGSAQSASNASVMSDNSAQAVPVQYAEEELDPSHEALMDEVRRLIEQSEARQKQEFSVALSEATQMQAQDRSRNLAAFREEIGNRQLQSQREILNVLQVMEQTMTAQPLPVSSDGGN